MVAVRDLRAEPLGFRAKHLPAPLQLEKSNFSGLIRLRGWAVIRPRLGYSIHLTLSAFISLRGTEEGLFEPGGGRFLHGRQYMGIGV